MLAYKFIEKIRRRIDARKNPVDTSDNSKEPRTKKNYFTEMIEVCNIDPENLLDRPEKELVEDLNQYIKVKI